MFLQVRPKSIFCMFSIFMHLTGDKHYDLVDIKTKFAWNNCIFSGLKHVHESSRMTDVVFMWTTFNPSFTELEVTMSKLVGDGHAMLRPRALRAPVVFNAQ